MAQVGTSQLSPPLLIDFHKTMMRESARATRDAIIRHKPHDPLSRLIILRTISRAIWQQTVPLARRVIGTRPLGAKFIQISAG
eukprot:331429-Pyramimonas_sp.AAC.1